MTFSHFGTKEVKEMVEISRHNWGPKIRNLGDIIYWFQQSCAGKYLEKRTFGLWPLRRFMCASAQCLSQWNSKSWLVYLYSLSVRTTQFRMYLVKEFEIYWSSAVTPFLCWIVFSYYFQCSCFSILFNLQNCITAKKIPLPRVSLPNCS